jgi:hypothetical protein
VGGLTTTLFIMASEYYIVKPSTKQIFYLGKRITHLEGISNWTYSKQANYVDWECYEDVVMDLQENSKYFVDADYRIGQIWDFCNAIYEFCDAPVYMDNDCSDNTEWKDWQEIDVFSDFLTTEEKWCELVAYVPRKYWIVDQQDINILLEYETVLNYLQHLSQEE